MAALCRIADRDAAIKRALRRCAARLVSAHGVASGTAQFGQHDERAGRTTMPRMVSETGPCFRLGLGIDDSVLCLVRVAEDWGFEPRER